MNIKLKVKPEILIGNTQLEVKLKYQELKKNDFKNSYFFNFFKINSKYKQIRDENNKYLESKLIKPRHYILHVYKFNKEFTDNIGLVLRQNEKNFNYLLIKYTKHK